MSTKEHSVADSKLSVKKITASLGTEVYERQFARQSSSAVQLIARMPLVRVVCGLFTISISLLAVTTILLLLRSQLAVGLSAWDVIIHLGSAIVTWWFVSMFGRVALYGEFNTGVSLFAPRENLT